MEGPAGSVHLRWGGCLPATTLPRGLVQTLQLRVLLLETGRGREGEAERRAGGGAVWSPSNRGTPRETPLRKDA